MDYSKILDRTSSFFAPFSGKDEMPRLQEIYSQALDEHEKVILQKFMVDNVLKFPDVFVELLEMLGGSGDVTEEFRQTQSALALHEDGYTRWGGLDVCFFDVSSSPGRQFRLIDPLVELAPFFDNKFFPLADDGCASNYICVSLKQDDYGSVYYIMMEGAELFQPDTWPIPQKIYPNIESFLSDLGPEKDISAYKIDVSRERSTHRMMCD